MKGMMFRAWCVVGGTCLAVVLVASAARAHQEALSLEEWGNFGSGPASCQRAIARAAATCSSRAVALHHACMMEPLSGATCDEEELDAGVAKARSRALASVQRACTSTDVQNLRYVDISEAMTDVIDICRQQEDALTSSVFGPLSLNGGAASDPHQRSCLRATASLSARLLRVASRTRRSAFDEIAAEPMDGEQRRALVRRSETVIDAAGRVLRRRFDAACPADVFRSLYGREPNDFFAAIARRADCLAGSAYVQNEVTCPPPACPNGMQEKDEQCDDGNDYEGDRCRADCVSNECELFPSTFALIQRAIFENRGCTEQICHGADRAGGLDLRAGVSYGNLIDQPSTTVPGFKRIDPGNKDNSLLWINLAARTLPGQYTAPLRGMPLLGDGLSSDELEAIRIWIESSGASDTVAVPGTGLLLDACLPEPVPAEIDPLEPPPADEGVQMHMPEWTLPPKSESEVCFSSYYDFTGKIPAYALSEDGTQFRYKRVDIRQDPLSHHLIVDLYRGPEAPNDPLWGTYTCKSGPRGGAVCDPLDLGFCGTGDCATDPDPAAIACIGFGPSTSLTTLTTGGFAFAQETTAEFVYPDGVYDELPVKGLALWNSHAFNLTRQTGNLEGWVNITFPEPDEQLHRQMQIFNTSKIFIGDNFFPAFIQPFQKLDICNVHVFGRFNDRFLGDSLGAREKAHIFELSGHTHRHGKRFQIFRGTFTCKGGPRDTQPCSPFEASMCPESGQCTDDGGRDPQDALLYTNLVYNDPVRVRFDPPMVFDGPAPPHDRSLTYCAHYSNGTPDIFDVKRRSTSPPAGEIFGFSIGGPCPVFQTRCIGGPRHDQVCNGDDAFCDSTAGAGDGDCDACPLSGGFRTEDEMFVLFGNYWVE